MEPEAVAQAIAVGIEKKQKDVYAPKSLRTIFRVQPLMGRRLRDRMYRALGAYDTFLNVDQIGRASYNDRIRQS